MAEPLTQQQPEKPKELTLSIDGRPVVVTPGTTLLQAALRLGIDISYFCWHPGLPIAAVCRQCLVEIVGQPKLAPACQVTCAEGMQVLTGSDRVLKVRQQMLEFTLLNHPVDCPICDKAGECQLQKLYLEWDAKAARIDYPKLHKPKVVDLGPTVVLDAERCILCTRCIRVCDEVAKVHQLEIQLRGNHAEICVAPGHHLDNPYSLNTVDVCPVGALTSKDFRFAQRAWELSATPSICTGCATGCATEIHHAKGRVYRLVPRLNAEVNRYWMCDAGRLTYKELRQGRLTAPRVLGGLRKWDDALTAAASALQPALAELGKVALVLSAQLANEDAFAAVRLAAALGIARVYTSGRPAGFGDDILIHGDKNPNSTGVRLIAGATAKPAAALEADLAAGALTALLCVGEVHLGDAALAAAARLKVVAIASHESRLTNGATVALPATAWAEHDATYVNAKGMCQRARAAVAAPAHARPAWRIVGELGTKLGQALAWASLPAVFADLKAAVPAFAQAELGPEQPTIQLRFKASRG
ncbi:MAG TPA: 2Fe-2S iron-sulfur cluster-binding protein [Polyangia bacterium]|jgi:NADH-quinone oxidoreductase subunit G